MAAGETIHTENSHKYGPRDARMLLLAGEWTPVAEWTDADDRFALLLAEARPRQDHFGADHRARAWRRLSRHIRAGDREVGRSGGAADQSDRKSTRLNSSH